MTSRASERAEHLANLQSLPYLPGYVPAPKVTGVTKIVSGRVSNAYNLVVSGHAAAAFLMDMEGRVLHWWHRRRADVWPGPPPYLEDGVNSELWRRARLLPNGDVLAIYEGIGIVRLDRASRVVWSSLCRAHHDMDFDDRGRIVTLTRSERRDLPELGKEGVFLDNEVTILSAGDGRVLRKVSIVDALLCAGRLGELRASPTWDVLHANEVQWLDGSQEKLDPAFRRGNVLVSIRQLNMIAVVDVDRGEIAWTLKGPWVRQHSATLLANGHILLFDNMGRDGRSRVLEVEPRTGRTVWSYPSRPEHVDLYSKVCGTVERLPSGNTLIVETWTGRAYAVAPDDDVVWQYVNPYKVTEEKGTLLIGALLDVTRIPRDRLPCADPENGCLGPSRPPDDSELLAARAGAP